MKRVILLLLLLSVLTFCCVKADSNAFDFTFTDRELSGQWDDRAAARITGDGTSCDITGEGISLDNNTLTISEEGVFILSGEFTDLPLVVSAGNKDKVQIVLSGTTITASTGPAIYLQSADKVFITLAENTSNSIADSADTDQSNRDAALDAALFSRTDLCINGKGTLHIKGNYKHGIVSKDDLIIVDAALEAEAASTALDGKDCVMLKNVTAVINAGSNGIRSDNTEDADRGFIYILDSTLTISAGGDGIQAETLLRSDSSSMTITTGGGSASAAKTTSSRSRFSSRGWNGYSSDQTISEDDSWKALKSASDIEINGGVYCIDSKDDSIHANGNLLISDGQFTLASGDDGIHADNALHIAGGDITITQSYEGIEASKLTISGGTIDITADDDGLNAAGGADGSASAERWGRGAFSNMVGEIIISGGYIHISASGDGIDSNNTIHVSGGVTLVSGASNSGNAAFDYDGEATVTGGILIAAGSSGMAQSFSHAENQGCLFFGLSGVQDRSLAIVDSSNRVIAAFTPERSYSTVVVTAPQLQLGSTYAVIADAVIDGADENGFASEASFTGGTQLGTIEMTTLLQGGSGHGMGGGSRSPGDGRSNPGDKRRRDR